MNFKKIADTGFNLTNKNFTKKYSVQEYYMKYKTLPYPIF